MLVTILLISVLSLLYIYLRHVYGYFNKHDIHYLPPVWGMGNVARPTLQFEHFIGLLDRIYKKFPDDRFVGMFEFFSPVIFVRDPQIIKQVCIRDSNNFLDHRIKINENYDPLFGRNLFSMKGQRWRDMRSTLSPAFTASKMKHMVPFMVECTRYMLLSVNQEMKNKNVTSLELDLKDLCTRFSSDVVASCTFGFKINSHVDKDNLFYNTGKIASDINFKILLKFFGFTSFPYIMEKLKVTLFDHKISSFFKNLILDTMKDREEKNIVRPDIIHLLMEAKKGSLVHEPKKDPDAGFATVQESEVGLAPNRRVWTDDDLIAQALLFFVAGFDTAATNMFFTLYELAINPDVQERLLQEIDDNNQRSGGQLSYQDIAELKYLDMVVSESLRLWSPGVSADRICKEPYNLGKPHPKAKDDYILQPGQGVLLPLWSIHHDEQYFPEPYRFNPERFSEENRHSIDPATYMPFGLGPRSCIGSRFALTEVKVMLHQLLTRFKVAPASKTSIPLTISPDSFNLRMAGGHWLKLELRD